MVMVIIFNFVIDMMIINIKIIIIINNFNLFYPNSNPLIIMIIIMVIITIIIIINIMIINMTITRTSIKIMLDVRLKITIYAINISIYFCDKHYFDQFNWLIFIYDFVFFMKGIRYLNLRNLHFFYRFIYFPPRTCI